MPEMRINQRSKMTGYLLDRCEDVLLSIEVRRDHLVAGLRERRGERLDDGTLARYDESVAMYTDWLNRDRCGLERTEQVLVEAKAELVFFRSERDDSTVETRQAYLGLRDGFEGLFEPAEVVEMGFARLTPEKPRVLLDHTSHLVDRLRGAERRQEEVRSRFASLRLRASQFGDALAPPVERLRAALEGVDHWSERVVIARVLRDDAKAKLRRTLRAVEDAFQSLFRLAELDEYVERVVSSRIRRRDKRRRGKRQKVASSVGAGRAAPAGPSEPLSEPRRPGESVPLRLVPTPDSAARPDRLVPPLLRRVVQRE